MSKLQIAKSACLAAVALTTLLGCATVPAQEMSDARQMVQAARDSGAAVEAPQKLSHAERLLDDATHALEQGHFDEARTKALAARNAAAMARSQSLQAQQAP